VVSSKADTVAQYLAELPPERRAVVSAVRDFVNANIPRGFTEGMGFGMIGWCVPLARFPGTYNKQPLAAVGLAAQKNAYSLYLMGCYVDSAEDRALRAAYAQAGKKLDMGKSCLRFRKLDDLLPEAIAPVIAGKSVDDFIALHESVHRK